MERVPKRRRNEAAVLNLIQRWLKWELHSSEEKKKKNWMQNFFPLFIGTHDKTVLQLIQMLLSGILMGLKCNQNTHKKIPQMFLTAFLISDLFLFFFPCKRNEDKYIPNLIKNAPRCVSTNCIIRCFWRKMHGAQLTIWFIWHRRTERFSHFNKNEHGFFLYQYSVGFGLELLSNTLRIRWIKYKLKRKICYHKHVNRI